MRPAVPVISSAAVVVAWQLVAHNSGAGWVQALGDVVCGTLVLGLLAPAVICARATVRVVSAPRNASAGLPVEVQVSAATRLRIRPIDPAGPEQFVGPAVGDTRGSRAPDSVTLLPTGRGVHTTLAMEISTASPFGFLWWRRRVTLSLPADLHIGPRLGEPYAAPNRVEHNNGDSRQRVPAVIGEPRAVRPYRPGDHRHWVHWPATAHRGDLMVREMEGPSAEPVTVTVRLPADTGRAESLAERALGTVVRLLDAGTVVVLVTDEASGPCTGPVGDRLTAARRLARAISNGGDGSASADGPTGADADGAVVVGDDRSSARRGPP